VEGAATNPLYTGVFVFDNDFPALLPPASDPAALPQTRHPLLRREPENGVCRVICFSPRHDLTLPELPQEQVRAVVDTWVAQCEELGARHDIAYVQVFENKGAMMGASNPHPHGQLWATAHLPTEPAKEQAHQADYLTAHDAPLLLDYLNVERREGERVLFENAHFAVLVPFWAVWPFETIVLPKRHVPQLRDLTPEERDGLAAAIRELTRRYDRLFDVSFPYSMGVHQAPYDGAEHPEWQTHLHFYPPLLRSATVRKFLVGYEMLAQAQRDLTPEQAAERLRGL
jgi:UDPglucose--hexose-1-phosphate uridylyltransferase